MAPDFGPPGPIRAVGYPVPIRTGANDPADSVGFTKDGSEFGYCHTDGGLGATWCEFVDAHGKSRSFDTADEMQKLGGAGTKLRAIQAWLKAEGVAHVRERGFDTTGPELVGEWAFADIVLDFVGGAATLTPSPDPKVLAQPFLRVGGHVNGYPAVHPFTMGTTSGVGTPAAFYGAFPNGVALSPDGKELGVLAAWHGSEYAGDFKVLRMPVNVFAARVYNDTGYALHKKGAFGEAQGLFAKATFADSTWDLAPYNLACAYARTGDGRAEAALKLALERGGDRIKVRARADVDFEGVRSADWFVELVGK